MREYIASVAAAAIMAAAADNFVPAKWQKYVSLLTGAVLLLTLISPLLKIRAIEIPSLALSENSVVEYDLSKEVEDELKARVEKDISTRLFEEFGVKTGARAELEVSEGKIGGVRKITLNCKENAEITKRLKEVYGCADIEY